MQMGLKLPTPARPRPSEALRLRALYAYREACNRAEQEGENLPAEERLSPPARPNLPPFNELSAKYEDLMSEWADDRPHRVHGVVAYAELVLGIIAGSLIGRYEEGGNIVAPERDLGYALDLQLIVRNWLNGIDIQESIEREREFRTDRAPQSVSPAVTATEEGGWPVLHRRWAELAARITQLELDIDERETVAKRPAGAISFEDWQFNSKEDIDAWAAEERKLKRKSRWSRSEIAKLRERLLDELAEIAAIQARGCDPETIARLRTELETLKNEADALVEQMWALPIDSFEAIAALLDIAIEENEITPPFGEGGLAEGWPGMNKILKALRQFAPTIEFTALPRAYPPSVDVEAIIAKA